MWLSSKLKLYGSIAPHTSSTKRKRHGSLTTDVKTFATTKLSTNFWQQISVVDVEIKHVLVYDCQIEALVTRISLVSFLQCTISLSLWQKISCTRHRNFIELKTQNLLRVKFVCLSRITVENKRPKFLLLVFFFTQRGKGTAQWYIPPLSSFYLPTNRVQPTFLVTTEPACPRMDVT